MAFIRMNKKNLEKNYRYLDQKFEQAGIAWGVVSKLLCGQKIFLKELMALGPRELSDTRITNLKVIKQIDPTVQTVYIKPPAKRSIKSVIQYADVSFNTEYTTIKMLSKEAVKQDKLHKVIIMIEMGDLREGVMGEELMDFYEQVFQLPKIEIIGIGTNLNCLHGVLPSHDKLIQLSLYKQLIETKFNRKIPWVSGGTSVALSLLFKKLLPKGINHFRLGETLFFGNNLVTGEPIQGMSTKVFRLFSEIIEVSRKPLVPIGATGENVAGETFEVNEDDYGKSSFRAILDLGLLDVNPNYLIPNDGKIVTVGASSDMIVVDLGTNPKNYKVGDLIEFELKYMGALTLLNSPYISKEVE